MARLSTLLIAIIAVWIPLSAAMAQSIPAMRDGCSQIAQNYFRDWEARSDTQYNGQRTDGTHALNGRIFLETRAEDFACSYDRSGRMMVEFFAEGRMQNGFLQNSGGGSQPIDTGLAQVTGIRGNDVLNVRSGPGTNFRVIGALSNGTQVRQLECQNVASSRWCHIEMMTDMRERGWVNARYLTGGAAAQLPENPPSVSAGGTSTVRVRFSAGANSAILDGDLAPGASRRYVIGARNLQELQVSISAGGSLSYQIFNPDGSFLLDQIPSAQTYRGQLWQAGDHVIEVINRSNRVQSYNLRISIR